MNRADNDIPRASFTVDEVVALTMNFYRRNYIEGLFLSSGVMRSPDYTMERMTRIAERLREERFGGYIHLKTIPGCSLELIQRAGRAADRLSVNIELPSEASLKRLAPQKSKQDILTPMACIGREWLNTRSERRKNRKTPKFSPAGHSTQMIIGASPEDDHHILHLAERMYQSYSLKRVYYSAYVPVGDDKRLPPPPSDGFMLREHRLYQADWLVRCYHFKADEILSDGDSYLDTELDPKAAWALRHIDFFPIEVNRDDHEKLLRVPGIGFRSAARIVQTRRVSALREEDLSKIGVVMKRARYFITINGHLPQGVRINPDRIRRELLPALRSRRKHNPNQLDLFAPAGAVC
jgi:putative DNA modification/repair radical SAM protein